MNKREKYTREWLFSSAVGEIMTMLFVAVTFGTFTAGELIAAWAAVHLISTYCVWTGIVVRDELIRKPEAKATSEKTTPQIRKVA